MSVNNSRPRKIFPRYPCLESWRSFRPRPELGWGLRHNVVPGQLGPHQYFTPKNKNRPGEKCNTTPPTTSSLNVCKQLCRSFSASEIYHKKGQLSISNQCCNPINIDNEKQFEDWNSGKRAHWKFPNCWTESFTWIGAASRCTCGSTSTTESGT